MRKKGGKKAYKTAKDIDVKRQPAAAISNELSVRAARYVSTSGHCGSVGHWMLIAM